MSLLEYADKKLSLKSDAYSEEEFQQQREIHNQRILNNFLDASLAGILTAFMARIVLLKSYNAILDLILPFVILLFIGLLYGWNMYYHNLKRYFHGFAVPAIGLLTVRKSVSQGTEMFYLNESFASWLIVVLIGSFISSHQWYKVVGINMMVFVVQFCLICRIWGLDHI